MLPLFLALTWTLRLSPSYSVSHDDKAVIEAVIRESEAAFAALDCQRIDSALAPGARWIEDSPPQPASPHGPRRGRSCRVARYGCREHRAAQNGGSLEDGAGA
jgi:hypothetical protein